MLYCDSLGSQRKREVIDMVKARNGQVVYGPKNASHIWQPIDCGHLGALAKSLQAVVMEEWMDTPCKTEGWKEKGCKNWELWESGLTASQKRILFTHWYSSVHGKICFEKYRSMRKKSLFIGGCLAGASYVSLADQLKGINIPGMQGKTWHPPDDTWTEEDEMFFEQHFTGSGKFKCCEAKQAKVVDAAVAAGPDEIAEAEDGNNSEDESGSSDSSSSSEEVSGSD